MQSCDEKLLLPRRYKNVSGWSFVQKLCRYFVSPYTVDFKMQTSHAIRPRLEITATYTASWDIFHLNSANPQCLLPKKLMMLAIIF